jgi:uncharacterized surface protein with fasciclin (FAS1) repeats
MKKIIEYKKIVTSISFLLSIVIYSQLITGCVDSPQFNSKESKEQVITEYVSSNKQFSEFAKLLSNTGMDGLLNIRGPYTLLLPTNDAMFAYYAEKNVKSLDGFDAESQKTLVMNHLILGEILSGDIGLGAIGETNALDDKIATEFSGNSGTEIYFNKRSKLIKRDIEAANGYIQVIDKVIDPETLDAYHKLESLGKFTIFTKGLELTGLKDTLVRISFDFGQTKARTRFTIMAVSDSVYNANGISSIDDLVKKYTDSPGTVKELENGFYRYMEYHCMAGTYFLSDFPSNSGYSTLYPILSYDNNISLIISDDYKINRNGATNEYTKFIIPESNYPSKNAAIHCVNGLLEVTQPAPATLTFETTDYFDLKQGDYYGKYYMKWYDGQNTFKNIKWEGDYLQYYFKDHFTGTLTNHDCLNINGYWWIEITTPKIMKGKYKLTGNIWANYIAFDVYVDGVFTESFLKADDANSKALAVVNWDKTETHTIKLVAVSYGQLFWDTVVFSPI